MRRGLRSGPWGQGDKKRVPWKVAGSLKQLPGGNPGEIRGKSSPPGTGVSSDVLGVVLWAHHGRAFPDHKVFRGGRAGRWEFAASGACSTPLYDIKKHQIRWLHRQLVSATSISTLSWHKFLPPPNATDARETFAPGNSSPRYGLRQVVERHPRGIPSVCAAPGRSRSSGACRPHLLHLAVKICS